MSRIGITTNGRKVHFESFLPSRKGRTDCGGEDMTPIGDTGDNRGSVIAGLLEANVRPSRLCRRCFWVSIRKEYGHRYSTRSAK